MNNSMTQAEGPHPSTPTQTDALCCECGARRRVSTRSNPRLSDPYSLREGQSAEQLSASQARGFDLGMEPFWRCLTTLKCKPCGVQTRHAVIRQGEHRNYAEQQDEELRRDQRKLRARLRRLALDDVDVRWRPADSVTLRAESGRNGIISLLHERECWGSRWTLFLSEEASAPALMEALREFEDLIDAGDVGRPWQTDKHGVEWQGVVRFARS